MNLDQQTRIIQEKFPKVEVRTSALGRTFRLKGYVLQYDAEEGSVTVRRFLSHKGKPPLALLHNFVAAATYVDRVLSV